MPQYLVAIQHPLGYDGSLEGPEMMNDIRALNLDMQAAGVRLFAGGLEPAPLAKSLRKQNEHIAITDGPYLEAKEYIGGFWILDCADMDQALGWAQKATVACRVPVEVRAFLSMPTK
ncbi:MAG: YciI family protein [Terriglobus sp.]